MSYPTRTMPIMTAVELPDLPDDLVLLAVWRYGDATLSVLQDPRADTADGLPQRVIVRLDDPARSASAETEAILPTLATLGETYRHAYAAAPGLVARIDAAEPAADAA